MPSPISPVELVKKAAVEAVAASKPVNLLFGTVISVAPIKIQVDQKAIYTQKMLAFTRNVTDHEMDISLSTHTDAVAHGHNVVKDTAELGEAVSLSHAHPIRGTLRVTVHNALRVGDRVLLARIQQGKKFVVLDRITPIHA